MFLKGYPLEAKTAPKNRNQSVDIFWARLASFCLLGFISDSLIVSKFHNKTHDPKGQENKIYTIVKGRESSIAATQSQLPAVKNLRKATWLVPLAKMIHFMFSFFTKENIQIVSEYDLELPQSQTAGKPMAPRGRAKQHLQDTKKRT